ncbi:MAG: hypothetical protein AB7N76_26840 [Planctomycetota bacterium]
MRSTKRRRTAGALALAAGVAFVLGPSLRGSERAGCAAPAVAAPAGRPPIQIAFQWHLHQPVYYPYEQVTDTQRRGAYSFDLFRTHADRAGPYTTWPVDAVQTAQGFPHGGAQVSFSGSLIENLDAFEREGWGFQGWKDRWRESNGWKTQRGNPRLDLVGFAYHHPLLPLLDDEVAQRQIGAHKEAYARAWNGPGVPQRPYSKGFFPPENAFAPWMIPALLAQGTEWVMVDNIHLQRACQGYPWTKNGGLVPPNPADQQNPDPQDWTQLRDLWAPTPVSAGWSFRPHWVRHVDPATGTESRVVAVPTARYMGNEDGRGGFGALQYERVMSQIEAANTDPAHPLLIVLHHDGDNYGGGADSYYHANWGRMLDWLRQSAQRFEITTIQDYLDRFPPARDDVAHVEPGSWSGADNGDAEFAKWLGDPNATTGYSPDRNSWAVMVDAANRVKTAGSLAPQSQESAAAWRLLLNGYTSCYWYWDGTEIWDSNPTRAANMATEQADRLLTGASQEGVGPQVFLPQREPYNPGGYEWAATPQPASFEVWTLAADVSGVRRVTLRYRVDQDGTNPLQDDVNETFAGGPGVSAWRSLDMQPKPLPASQTNPAPRHRAERYAAQVPPHPGQLLDYYVEAEDGLGNLSRSPILHVFVGTAGAPLTLSPALPAADEAVHVRVSRAGVVRWGVDGWKTPPAGAVPAGSAVVGGVVETPLQGPDAQGHYEAALGPWLASGGAPTRLDLVVRYSDGTWENNGGHDYHLPIAPMPLRITPSAPRWDETIRIEAGEPGAVRWGVDGWKSPPAWLIPAGTSNPSGVAETRLAPTGRGTFALELGPCSGPSDLARIDLAVRYDSGGWDNAGGLDYHVRLQPRALWWSPARLTGTTLLVLSKEPGVLRYGLDGWTSPRDERLQGPDAQGLYYAQLTGLPATTRTVDMALHKLDGTWDNAGGGDYHALR